MNPDRTSNTLPPHMHVCQRTNLKHPTMIPVHELSIRLLVQLMVTLVILSPPCTIFSSLQAMWNFKKMRADVVSARWAEGMRHLDHAMDCARTQYDNGRVFIFEHPANATSWKQPSVTHVRSLPGVLVIVFDACMLGLTSKVSGIPMKKRTRIMTNSTIVAEHFRGRMCDGTHRHQRIHQCEGGVSRAVWAQIYPPPMVRLLAQCASDLRWSRMTAGVSATH